MPNDNVLTTDHAFALYMLARTTSDSERWIEELRKAIAAHPDQPKPKEPPSPDDIQGWAVTVEVNGVGILTISNNCVSGIDNIADFDGIVRNCAQHLIGFIGQPEPRAEVTLDDAAITACALMIKGICMTHSSEEWTEKIEGRIRFMLKAAKVIEGMTMPPELGACMQCRKVMRYGDMSWGMCKTCGDTARTGASS